MNTLKKLLAILLLPLAFLTLRPEIITADSTNEAHLREVISPNRFVVEVNGELEEVKLIGVAPAYQRLNKSTCLDADILRFLHVFLRDEALVLLPDTQLRDKDFSRRLLRSIKVKNNFDLGLYLLEKGLAVIDTQEEKSRMYTQYQEAAELAFQDQRGIWSPNCVESNPLEDTSIQQQENPLLKRYKDVHVIGACENGETCPGRTPIDKRHQDPKTTYLSESLVHSGSFSQDEKPAAAVNIKKTPENSCPFALPIKGNIDPLNGEKLYYTALHPEYESIIIYDVDGEACFSSSTEARQQGFKRARYTYY